MRWLTIITTCMFIFSIIPHFLAINSCEKETIILTLDVCKKSSNVFSSNADTPFTIECPLMSRILGHWVSLIPDVQFSHQFILTYSKEHPPKI